MRKKVCLLFGVMLLWSSALICLASEKTTRDIFAMDTHISITVYGEMDSEVLDAAESLLTEREQRWSVTLEESEISRINHAGGNAVAVSEDTAEILSYALRMAENTGGAFDPTIYPLVRAWGFTTDEYRIPQQAEIDRLLKLVDYNLVSVDGGTVNLAEGMQIDLGGIAKGYAGDEVADLLKQHGVESAMINLGGNVHVIGNKPDGSAWKIGVKSPADDGLLGVLSVCDQCIITSGAYERYFTAEDGTKYGHIIDPDTGYPVDNGVLSVTVVGSEGGRCDALSTALFVMGADGACDYWRENEGFEMIILAEDGSLYITEGIEADFAANTSAMVSEICVIER